MKLTVFFMAIFLHLTSGTTLANTRYYIAGNGFRNCADYTVEHFMCSFNPEDVEANSIIYIEADSLTYFFNAIFPLIKNPIILISHNGDLSAPGPHAKYLNDQRIIMWFGQNCDTTPHPKFYPIPIGIANAKWEHGNTQVFDMVLDKLEKRVNHQQQSKLYVNISRRTNPIRAKLYDAFKNKPFVALAPRRKPKEYLAEMAQYRFTLSPFGNGLDCHRTWEALLVGSIPVVKTSTLDALYENLPVIIVNDWHEISLDFLEKKYAEMKNKHYAHEKLFMNYWEALIKSYKNTSFSTKAKSTKEKAC